MEQGQIARLTTANLELAKELLKLRKRDETLRAIADLADISGLEFARKYPGLNRLLDEAGYESWGAVLAQFASQAYEGGEG